MRGLKQFFKNAAARVPIQSQIRDESTPPPAPNEGGNSDCSTSAISFKRKGEELNNNSPKRAKVVEASQTRRLFSLRRVWPRLFLCRRRVRDWWKSIQINSSKNAKIEASQDTRRIFDCGLYDVMVLSAYENNNDLQELGLPFGIYKLLQSVGIRAVINYH